MLQPNITDWSVVGVKFRGEIVLQQALIALGYTSCSCFVCCSRNHTPSYVVVYLFVHSYTHTFSTSPPTQHRASLASIKDRLDSLEKRFQNNRQNMTKQAKKAAKLEKRLKLLTGGYQSRASALSKQLNDVHEQCEHSFIEMNTFKVLQEMEGHAIPRRLEVCSF